MVEARELRGLVIVEIAAVIALAIAPFPDALPLAVPLFVVASLSRWIRYRGWAELFHGASGGLIGAVAGVVALGLAIVAGTPLVETITNRAVEWAMYPLVRGQSAQLLAMVIFVGVMALVAELALRGWIVERVLELGGARPGIVPLAILVGAAADALLYPGPVAARIGAGLFGIGLGAMYVASGRSVVAPICARVAFGLVALLLESMKLLG